LNVISKFKNLQPKFNGYVLNENQKMIYVKLKTKNLDENSIKLLADNKELHLYNYPLDRR
jgi:hypothetical protein